jgi:hypothetical protein
MIHQWSILCKKALVDNTTNIISLLEILEKLTVDFNAVTPVPTPTTLPNEFAMPFDFELVSMISDISEKNKNPFVKIELFNAQKEKIGETENKLEIPAGAKKLRSRAIFNAIKIKGEGVYSFKVNLKENEKDTYKQVAEIPLEVEIKKHMTPKIK